VSSLEHLGELRPTGQSSAKGRVANTAEFRRVYSLGRRPQGLPAWMVEEMTEWLKTEDGTWTLREVQAQALRELYDFGGVFVAAGVGHGKTLISLLAAMVVEAERPTLVVPAALRQKTLDEARDVYSEHWEIPVVGEWDDPAAQLKVISYEMLGRAEKADWLDRRKPDLLIFDEVHKLKNRTAAVTRRVARFMAEHKPTKDVRVVAMSGTVTQRKLADFAHVMSWCLGPEHSPVPQVKEELETWGRAVDRKVERRPDPGALTQLVEKAAWQEACAVKHPTHRATEQLKIVRSGLYDRFAATKGVIYTTTASVEASIYMGVLPIECGETKDAIEVMRETKSLAMTFGEHFETEETPEAVRDELLPQDTWRISRQMALGFYYVWDPPAPVEWMTARKAWRRFAREVIGDDPEHSPYDSELTVINAVDRIEADKPWHIDNPAMLAEGIPHLSAWREVRDAFTPNPVPRWFTDEPLEAIVASLRPNQPTLVWVEHRCVGEKLADMLGVPYFANKGLSSDGQSIEQWDTTRHAVVSIAANSTGRNLQGWHRNLVVTPMPNGGAWQQMMGRTHRQGQENDEVYFRRVVACETNEDDYLKALNDAEYVELMTGEPQKLRMADKI